MVGLSTSFNLNLQDSIFLSVEIMIGILTVCGNSLVLITIYSSQSLHSATNMLLCNLAAADICVGMFMAPSAILAHYGIPANYYGCVFLNCIMLTFCDASILTLLVIAGERFMAIRQPFVYQRVATIKRAHKVNLIVWIISVVVGMFPMLGWRHPPKEIHFCSYSEVIKREYMVYVQFFGIILTSFIAMFVSYLYIFIAVRKHIQEIEFIRNMLCFPPDSNFQRSYRRDLKTAKVLFMMLVVFSHCWLPISIMHAIPLFCDDCSFPNHMFLIATSLSHVNSFVNPLLYSTSNSAIKVAMWKLIFRDGGFELTAKGSVDVLSRRQTLYPSSTRQKSSQSLAHLVTAEIVLELDPGKGYVEYNMEADDFTTTIY